MKKIIGVHKRRKVHDEKVAFRMAIISSRGQVTIPQDVRDIMHVRRGSVVGFEPTKRGILMVSMKVEPENPYTEAEWEKIEKLSKSKGKVYHSAEEAKKHVANL
ncbi:MAG: AbrB/MazE/SpoVT family DNA-binding domain-containing protein [Candidatus Omnitrophota bacterium]|jgi:bifunctional DNA-binding transcriptional regulator/antitoxin component of YhaV-PrlF toxin-antitoxin module